MRQDDARQALQAIGRRLEEERRRAAALEAARREQEQARTRDARLFRAAVQDAVPLAPSAPRPDRPRPAAPLPARRRAEPEPAGTEAPLSDGVDADSTGQGVDETPSFARPGVSPQTLRRLRRGDWAVEARLDLHGHTRDQARTAVGRFLQDAVMAGRRCVRIVHGKGLGSVNGTPVLATLTRRWLTQSNHVLAYVQARDADGGAGALLVLLKPGERVQAPQSTQ